ncbi:MAG: hypothetical protein JWL63_3283 [Rhodocyclales bacterium]|nr:hypothetical protein [Rhodocyclales bacterium]
MPGVGTEFKEIGEPTESSAGKAFAKGGEPRIIWGIFQAMNALHNTALGGDAPLYKDTEVGQLAQAYGREVGRTQQSGNGKGPGNTITHKKWFAPHIAKLQAALAAKPKPTIPSLTLSVFGFSRGAAQAAAFCHLFDELLEGGRLAGIPARIRFLGVFDTVATVGGSASMARTLPMPDAVFDGHWDWAAKVLQPLPGSVEAGAHYISAHELRMNFPVTQLQGNIEEVYFPGVHSDVGGGYAPGEQGKGRGKQAALLSQIPLLHMYKAARMAGVPLKPFGELETTIRDDMEVDADLASAWEAYTAALGPDGGVLKKHMQLFYRWRAARLNSLESTASFLAASAQDQQDMRDANRMLKGDLEALHVRRHAPPSRPWRDEEPQQRPFAPQDIKRINQWQYFRAQNYTPLDGWEKWALDIFDKPQPLPAAVERFFDDYVHDSFAGFYMAGEVTEYDKRVKVAKVMEEKPESLRGFDKKVYTTTSKARAAQAKKRAGEAMTPEETALANEAEYGTPYPPMTDEDTADMRSVLITTQTATRREGGGYILRRGYYPHTGFFYRRSIHEQELETAPGAYNPAPGKSAAGAPIEFVWSEHLHDDVIAAAGVAAGTGEPALA